jgi:TonB family protein
LWRVPVHDSQFADVPHSAALGRCERTRDPEALATPDPLLDSVPIDMRVRVSFIIGTDGRVHSPLVLESSGQSEDQVVLDAVRSWRYRPATCNGVPTETEGRVDFSRH